MELPWPFRNMRKELSLSRALWVPLHLILAKRMSSNALGSFRKKVTEAEEVSHARLLGLRNHVTEAKGGPLQTGSGC